MRRAILLFAAGVLGIAKAAAADPPVWSGFAADPQHTADSTVASDSLSTIRWQTPVDLDPQYSSSNGVLYAHYGSPLVTANNTIIVPVKTGAYGGFEVEAINGGTGAIQWTQTSDYILPAHNWTPQYAPAITPDNTLYYPGAGGTVYAIANADSATPAAPTQIAFFGNSNYAANSTACNSQVFIDTPITSDSSGDIYFGYRVTGSSPPLGLTSGIARIAPNGTATYQPISSLVSDGSTTTVMNDAPAISADGSALYVAVSNGSAGDLVELNAANLHPMASVALTDPATANPALLDDDGTASVTIGPDGQVYYGVLENPSGSHNYRGWLLQFSPDLSQEKTPGSFGWDDTASIVPASMVPSYHGPSTYLLMTKYNNYAIPGHGDGVNEIAILDPNATMTDPISGKLVMNVVESIAGPTPDQNAINDGFPNAVKEWCINSAVVDPATDSVLVNSEDGNLYRWNLSTDTLTQAITLTGGLGEAYTPTIIGADGAVYAINDATLYSIVPEPGSALLVGGIAFVMGMRRRR